MPLDAFGALALWGFSVPAMILAVLVQLLWGLGKVPDVRAQFNAPPGVDTWCGKAYRATNLCRNGTGLKAQAYFLKWQNSSFNPGGWLDAPKAVQNGTERLDLRIYPRYNYYLASENKASFIIDTPVQDVYGQPYTNSTYDPSTSPNATTPFTEMRVLVRQQAGNAVLVNWTMVPVNGSVEVEFDLGSMTANASTPWSVYATGVSPDGLQSYYSTSSVTVLPDRNDTGSMSRIDRFHGGLQARSSLTKDVWKPIFPYSFYTSWDWISETLVQGNTTHGDLSTFRSRGYNIIHPVPPGGCEPFNHTILEQFLTKLDSLELYLMYDMRNSYQNLSCISSQLPTLQSHPSLLLYYTADEPDGTSDPLNATSLAYAHIRDIDPYHPVSLVLNCANYHFSEYSSGADILLEDTYPVATNTSFSSKFSTPCNTTYGDCGCDNCHSLDPAYPEYVENPFRDITDRVASLQMYQEWLGATFQKPIWGVPQAFFDGVDDYWQRFPTAAEEAVMGALRIVVGVKGIVAWDYPTSDEIEGISGSLAKVFTMDDVVEFTLGGERTRVEGLAGGVEAAVWKKSAGEGALVVYVNPRNSSSSEVVEIPVEGANGTPTCLWGPCRVSVAGDGQMLQVDGVDAFEVGVVML